LTDTKPKYLAVETVAELLPIFLSVMKIDFKASNILI